MSDSSHDKLRCIFLLTPGEILEAADDLAKLGYLPEAYPSTQDISPLKDTVPLEKLNYFSPNWKDNDTPYVRSLRSSFSRMILDPQFNDNDLIIFGESDSAAVTEAAPLRKALEKELTEHPETDIFRLFHHKAISPPPAPVTPEDYNFSPLLTSSRTKGSLYVWGTHALVIPASKRQKVADLFRNCSYPIDNAIEWAAAQGQLNVRTSVHNHFFQQVRTHPYDRAVSYAWRQRGIAICVPIYQLEHLEYLIAWVQAELYPNLHLFVALKNIPESIFRQIVEPRWKSVVKSGLLTLRLFPGKNPASDILDTVRGFDTDKYEHFLILNETDMPAHGYLKTLNDFHARIPQPYSIYYKGKTYKKNAPNTVFWKEQEAPCTGFSLTREAFTALKSWENNTPPEPCGESAGTLLFQLITRLGRRNIASFLSSELCIPLLQKNLPTPTAAPESLLKARATLKEYFTASPDKQEHLLEIRHPSWNDLFHIIGEEGWRNQTGDHARVLSFDGQSLEIKWDRWGQEHFFRDEKDGIFRPGPKKEHKCDKASVSIETVIENTAFDSVPDPKPSFPAEKEQSEENRLPALPQKPRLKWGVCAVAILRESYYWLQDWVEFHLRAGASLVVIYDNTGSEGSLDIHSNPNFKNGHFQMAKTSKRGEEYGQLTSHLTDEQILQEAQALTVRYGPERVRIVPWQPKDPKTGRIIHGQVEAYEDFILSMGHELDWCAFIDLDEYLYCAPGKNIGYILEHTERENPDVGRLQMKAWKFPLRWGKNGPLDISQFRQHLQAKSGADKNMVRLRDSRHASIHWDWAMNPGIRTLSPHPEELAFCHYNLSSSELIDVQSLINPREFLEKGPWENISRTTPAHV